MGGMTFPAFCWTPLFIPTWLGRHFKELLSGGVLEELDVAFLT